MAKARQVGVLATGDEDVRSLRELITYGLKGLAAYTHHAAALGQVDGGEDAFLQKALAATLDSSVRAMAAAFELADFGPWRAIIESVVYEGLYAVGAAVLNGTFRKGRRRKQRKAGA